MTAAGNAATTTPRVPREIEGKIVQLTRINERLSVLIGRHGDLRTRLIGGRAVDEQQPSRQTASVTPIITSEIEQLANLIDKIQNQVDSIDQDLTALERL